MRALYFSKRELPGRSFYRCGVCRQDFSVNVDVGILIMVGSDCVGLTCAGCFTKARDLVMASVPHSFPDLDDRGDLLC